MYSFTYGKDVDENVEEPESIPTGYEEFLTIYFLDFEEFLWVEGYEKETTSILKDYFVRKGFIPNSINEKYKQLFREYIVVDGMSEVVADYVVHQDFNIVSGTQDKILENYRFDIVKHTKGTEKIKVRRCYDALPKQIAKKLTKFQYSTIEKGQTSKKYEESIQRLKDSNLVNPCYNIRHAYIPLMGNSIKEQFKLYVNNTGLLCAMYGFQTKKAISNNTIKWNVKGGIYENIIGECLVKRDIRSTTSLMMAMKLNY